VGSDWWKGYGERRSANLSRPPAPERANDVRPNPLRPNRHPGSCSVCRGTVPGGKGILEGGPAGWRVRHRDATECLGTASRRVAVEAVSSFAAAPLFNAVAQECARCDRWLPIGSGAKRPKVLAGAVVGAEYACTFTEGCDALVAARAPAQLRPNQPVDRPIRVRPRRPALPLPPPPPAPATHVEPDPPEETAPIPRKGRGQACDI
jgi:hypothetical protein